MHFGSSVSVTKLYFIRQTLEKLLLNPQLSECRSGFYLVSGFKTLHTRSVKEATHCRYHSPNRFQFCHSGYSSYQPTATRYLSSTKTAGKEIESGTSLEINVNRVLLDLFHQCCTSLERFFFISTKNRYHLPIYHLEFAIDMEPQTSQFLERSLCQKIRVVQVATDVLSKDDTLQDRTAIPVEDIVDQSDFCLSTTNFKCNNTHDYTSDSL